MCRFEDCEGGVKRPSQWVNSIKAGICALFDDVVTFEGYRGKRCGGIRKKKEERLLGKPTLLQINETGLILRPAFHCQGSLFYVEVVQLIS